MVTAVLSVCAFISGGLSLVSLTEEHKGDHQTDKQCPVVVALVFLACMAAILNVNGFMTVQLHTIEIVNAEAQSR